MITIGSNVICEVGAFLYSDFSPNYIENGRKAGTYYWNSWDKKWNFGRR